MRTVFHSTTDWSRWRPDGVALDTLVDLCERTWPEGPTFSFELDRRQRTDQAETADEARELLRSEGALAAATSISLTMSGPHESIRSLSFRWGDTYAMLTVSANDEISADVLKQKAAEILDAGVVQSAEVAADAPEDVKTQFRPSQVWTHWRAHRAALHGLLDLCERTWPEPSTFSLELARPQRNDRATGPALARTLIDADHALEDATGMTLMVLGPHDSIDSISFDWHGHNAGLSVSGRDEIASEALRTRAAEILEAGAVDVSEPVAAAQTTFEQETVLSLARVPFAGTYANLAQLIRDLADQVAQVTGDLDRVYIALTEHGQTVTVRHIGELNHITDRDVHDLRDLSISLSSNHGASLSLYLSNRGTTMHGNARGPDEAPVRALRAAANDLLRDRGRSPHWLTYRWLVPPAVALYAAGLVLAFVLDAGIAGVSLLGMAVVLGASPKYLPDVELLGPNEKTRWSRWSRYILALAIAWIVGSLALPVFGR